MASSSWWTTPLLTVEMEAFGALIAINPHTGRRLRAEASLGMPADATGAELVDQPVYQQLRDVIDLIEAADLLEEGLTKHDRRGETEELATYTKMERVERVVRSVEYHVPCYGTGAAWVEVMKAIHAAHRDMARLGMIERDENGKPRDAADDLLLIKPGDDEVLVTFSYDAVGKWAPEPEPEPGRHHRQSKVPRSGLTGSAGAGGLVKQDEDDEIFGTGGAPEVPADCD